MKNFKETAEKITLHGLGFLQIKLPGNQRLHAWHPSLPKRKCFNDSYIHDHRFGFTSKVLIGTQLNQFYRIVPNSTKFSHTAYLHEGERTEFGNRPWVPDFDLELEVAGGLQMVRAGKEYSVSPYIYHATRNPEPTVTLMTKTSEHDKGAHSICRKGVEPDVDFDRKQWPEEKLWAVFEECLRFA